MPETLIISINGVFRGCSLLRQTDQNIGLEMTVSNTDVVIVIALASSTGQSSLWLIKIRDEKVDFSH